MLENGKKSLFIAVLRSNILLTFSKHSIIPQITVSNILLVKPLNVRENTSNVRNFLANVRSL